ncbi:nucleoside hydrolase [Pseudonocardia sp. H11422]|uniref:nucleoside hydrolase n=1 Tax=Pseudonocardia sp. H11422 TaxID=2835866 RepID=UPI0027E22CDC|nr:nucleoside hydrolase [Pseudonocardia sp. H11422]
MPCAAEDRSEDLPDAPIVIDTDIGGDADDALAVVAAARHQPRLALVVTSDETRPPVGDGQRARFARFLLDLLGRTDVTVAAGPAVGDTRYWCVDGLVPASVPLQFEDVVAAVRTVCAGTDGPVRWVGMGPLTNLAHLTEMAPELAGRLRVTQMGGALNYRHPDRAEHNIRLDVPAAHQVLAAVADGRLGVPEFVTSDVTFTPRLAITAEHPIHRALAAPTAPAWASILVAHLDRWYTGWHPATIQHDALTLSAALGLPFVDSAPTAVALDAIGRMTAAPQGGVPMRLSRAANHPAFMAWLGRALDPVTATPAPA